MSGQINLYHPRYRKQRDWLTLPNVAGAAAGLLLVLVVAGIFNGRQAVVRVNEAAVIEAQLKAVKADFDAQVKAAANSKPSPQLAAEVAAFESRLDGRDRIARLLEGGAIGNTAGFSDYLRGFARQSQEGLWLTGFTIGSGGNDMEIRGRMLASSALPDYIRRLGSEKAFQGRSFAALTLNRPESAPVVAPAAAAPVGVSPVPQGFPSVTPTTSAPRFVEFILTPRLESPGGKL